MLQKREEARLGFYALPPTLARGLLLRGQNTRLGRHHCCCFYPKTTKIAVAHERPVKLASPGTRLLV